MSHHHDEEEFKKALAKAYRILSYRDHSIFELKEKLIDKEFSDPTVDEIIEELTGQGLVNDENFALNFAYAKAKNRYWGPRKISHALSLKGIDRDEIERAFEYDEIDFSLFCFQALVKWLKRKNLTTQALDKNSYSDYDDEDGGNNSDSEYDDTLKRKAISYLESKGYLFNTIMEAVNNKDQ